MKRLPARKKRAIRRCLWALVILLVVNQIFHVGFLLPVQAIRLTEDHEGVYPDGTAIARRWDRELRWNHVVYLTANETAVFLGDARLEIFGWDPGFGCAVDCADEAPMYAGARGMSRDDRRLAYYFGRVDDPEIVTVAISVQREDYVDGGAVREEVYRMTVEADDFLTRRGRRYFLIKDDCAAWPEGRAWPCWAAIGYDASGTEVYRCDIDQWSIS